MLRELDAIDEELHAASVEQLERRIVELALERTNARNGAIFLWDSRQQGLAIDFHMVEGLVVNLPGAVLQHRHDGRPNGIALWVLEQNEPYLCRDAGRDPIYAHYFLDVMSVAAVPIPYQDRAIGVLSVSSRERDAFTPAHLVELQALAGSAAKFLRRAQLYRSQQGDPGTPFLIKGLSPQWLEVERQLERVSPTSAPVLITGESGTGKELVAHAIHFASRRASGPFVTVNCAAIPETLLESILFGHVRGAFTGAAYNKIGEFEKANGGTLFLDEMGELPQQLQAKVLRAVEQGEVQPLGSNKPPLTVDVRVICATNRDLAQQVRDGEFRDDLYYRISVVSMELPPLRSYKHNLEVLAHVAVKQAAERHEKPVTRISPEAMALLHAYDFPGNVRELKNAMEHAVIMAQSDQVAPRDLPRSLTGAAPPAVIRTVTPPSEVEDAGAGAPPAGTLRELREAWLAPLERRYLQGLLSECRGNVRAAARRAGVNPVTMYRLLRRRGVLEGRLTE